MAVLGQTLFTRRGRTALAAPCTSTWCPAGLPFVLTEEQAIAAPMIWARDVSATVRGLLAEYGPGATLDAQRISTPGGLA
jgi:hypothetical protein